jgi:iron complex transport system permease protein
MASRSSSVSFLLTLIVAPLLALVLHICIGKYPLNPTLIPSLFVKGLCGISEQNPEQLVLFNIRLPRAIMAMLFGATMGVTGASLQSILKNPLVSPYTLGISSGAAVGAALSLAFNLGVFSTEASAFTFALLAIFLTLTISRFRGGLSPITIVLAGIIVTALFQGVLTLIQIIAQPENVSAIVGWIAGRLNAVTWNHVLLSVPLAFVGMLGILLVRWRVFVLSMGDEEARALGMDIVKERLVVIILVSLAVSSVVTAAGVIGWVCLIAPHLTRLVIGPDPKRLLPASLSLGATFLLIADALAKSVWVYEIPVGVVVTLVGAPLFLYLLRRSMHAYGV